MLSYDAEMLIGQRRATSSASASASSLASSSTSAAAISNNASAASINIDGILALKNREIEELRAEIDVCRVAAATLSNQLNAQVYSASSVINGPPLPLVDETKLLPSSTLRDYDQSTTRVSRFFY